MPRDPVTHCCPDEPLYDLPPPLLDPAYTRDISSDDEHFLSYIIFVNLMTGRKRGGVAR